MISQTNRHVRRTAAVFIATAALVAPSFETEAHDGGRPDRHDQSPTLAVVEWNQHASDAIINPPTAPTPGRGLPPQVAVIHMAIVQTAVYDAVNAIDGGRRPYLDGLPAARRSASVAAAAATAAHDVLVGLRAGADPLLAPDVVERLDVLHRSSLDEATEHDGRRAVDEGVTIGTAVAEAMLAERSDDGRFPDPAPRFPEGTGIGEWRPAPPTFGSDPFAWVADVDTFSVLSSSQFRTKGPHPLGSRAYAREFAEVAALGGDGVVTPTERTPEQDALALFLTTHPIELWNRTFRTVAVDEGLDTTEQARFLAMANMTGADSHINCWDDKRYWSFWRPIDAIRAGDLDGNRRTVGDPNWTPLRTTPPYPEHPSGYNCVTAGFMYAADRFFRGRVEFDVVRLAAGEPDQVRHYDRFEDVVRDAIDVRIFQGIHFRAADVQAADLGRRVARWVDRHEFGRARHRADDDHRRGGG